MKFLNFYKTENGQATVEFALVLPILLIVICGIIDFGWFYSKKIQLQSASYTGARHAIVSNNDVSSQENVISQIRASLPGTEPNSLDIQLSYSSGISGNVTVTLTETVEALTPISWLFTSDQNIEIKASATMKMSY